MQPAPLQLNQSVIGEVAIKAFEGSPSATSLTITTQPSFGRNDANPKQWIVKLKVLFKGAEEKPAPYEGHVEVSGVFTITEDLPEDKVLKIVPVNCTMLLYSTVREIIASLTGRGPHGMLTLPSVLFSDLALTNPIVENGIKSAEST
jgi:preprotein translocase subunit SecB